jgi:hypothetical protein
MKKQLPIGIIVFSFLFILQACAGSSGSKEIEVKDAWARASVMAEAGEMGSMNGAAFFSVANLGESDDKLIGAKSDVAKVVEMHMTEMDGEVMRMRPVESIVIPATSKVNFEPGGLHIMLIGLTKELKAGETVELILNFEKAGEIVVKAEVRE